MITGRSNFPTERNRKRNQISDKRRDERIEFRVRARRAILSKLRPDLAPIRASDADAIERLEVELAHLEDAHEQMKAANVAIRKNKKAGEAAIVEALLGLNFSTAQIQELLNPVIGRAGYQTFHLSNNSANIARVRARIQQITIAQATPLTELQGSVAKLVDDPPANRVRLFFPGKPDQAMLARLKQPPRIFRWKRSLSCWQAFRNANSLRIAADIAGIIKENAAA